VAVLSLPTGVDGCEAYRKRKSAGSEGGEPPPIDLAGEAEAYRSRTKVSEPGAPATVQEQIAIGVRPYEVDTNFYAEEGELWKAAREYGVQTGEANPDEYATRLVMEKRRNVNNQDETDLISPFFVEAATKKVKDSTEPGSLPWRAADAVLRDQAENTQRNNVNISLGNREWLELIGYKLTRLNDNFDYRLSRLEDQIDNRLRPVEKDIEQMRRDLDKTKTDVDELKQQSILVKFAPSTQPVAPNGTLRKLFWVLVGFGFVLTVLISVLIVVLARGYR
jgi:hypothetical protein